MNIRAVDWVKQNWISVYNIVGICFGVSMVFLGSTKNAMAVYIVLRLRKEHNVRLTIAIVVLFNSYLQRAIIEIVQGESF